MQICLPSLSPKDQWWDKTRARGVVPSCQQLSTLGYSQALVDYFAQISSVFKSWITRVYLLQIVLVALHKKIRKKTCCIIKRNYVKLDFMFSQHEFLLNPGYFVIPELNIKTYHIMQSSLRWSRNLNDRRNRGQCWQSHCFWNPKRWRRTSEKFCYVFNSTYFELKKNRTSYNWFEKNSLDGRREFGKKLIMEI